MRHGTLAGGLILLVTATALDAQSQSQSPATDRISAPIIAQEIRTLGHTASIDVDESGDPRIETEVDGHKWQIYFYDCDPKTREQRQCDSFQFFADNILPGPVSPQTINQWNRQWRYARAYFQQANEPGCPAAKRTCAVRIELDVKTAGTGADPAQTFRTYFAIFQHRAVDFRKAIGAK